MQPFNVISRKSTSVIVLETKNYSSLLYPVFSSVVVGADMWVPIGQTLSSIHDVIIKHACKQHTSYTYTISIFFRDVCSLLLSRATRQTTTFEAFNPTLLLY